MQFVDERFVVDFIERFAKIEQYKISTFTFQLVSVLLLYQHCELCLTGPFGTEERAWPLLACLPCNPGVAGSISRSSSLSDETLNRGPVSMT